MKMSARIDRTGERRTMNNGLMATVIAYRKYSDIDIQFDNGCVSHGKWYCAFSKGSVSCPLIINLVDNYAEVTNPNITGCKWFMDVDDLPLLGTSLWCIDSPGYVFRNINHGHKLLHRIIMGAPDNMHVDHINGNRLDNRRSNLRLCSQAENMRNSCKRVGNTSGYKGVSWDKKSGKWMAQIQFNKKVIHLGLFGDRLDAARAYNEAAVKYHGEFAGLNKGI